MIKIIPPEVSSEKLALSGVGTKVETVDGTEVQGVSSISIRMAVNEPITASVTVLSSLDTNVWAMPFMSEESFLKAAKRYGYTVTKDT